MRRIRLAADYPEETATRYRKHVYQFGDTDVIVVEGIYLLKTGLRRHSDVSAGSTARSTPLSNAQVRGDHHRASCGLNLRAGHKGLHYAPLHRFSTRWTSSRTRSRASHRSLCLA